MDLRSRLTSNISMLQACLSNLTERKTERSLARLEKHVDMQEQQQILDWVSKDCERQRDRLNWLIQRRDVGTRRWLFDSPRWQTWISDEGRGTTLFCLGIPGAGKTHTSASKYITSIFFISEDMQIQHARNCSRLILKRLMGTAVRRALRKWFHNTPLSYTTPTVLPIDFFLSACLFLGSTD